MVQGYVFFLFHLFFILVGCRGLVSLFLLHSNHCSTCWLLKVYTVRHLRGHGSHSVLGAFHLSFRRSAQSCNHMMRVSSLLILAPYQSPLWVGWPVLCFLSCTMELNKVLDTMQLMSFCAMLVGNHINKWLFSCTFRHAANFLPVLCCSLVLAFCLIFLRLHTTAMFVVEIFCQT